MFFPLNIFLCVEVVFDSEKIPLVSLYPLSVFCKAGCGQIERPKADMHLDAVVGRTADSRSLVVKEEGNRARCPPQPARSKCL